MAPPIFLSRSHSISGSSAKLSHLCSMGIDFIEWLNLWRKRDFGFSISRIPAAVAAQSGHGWLTMTFTESGGETFFRHLLRRVLYGSNKYCPPSPQIFAHLEEDFPRLLLSRSSGNPRRHSSYWWLPRRFPNPGLIEILKTLKICPRFSTWGEPRKAFISLLAPAKLLEKEGSQSFVILKRVPIWYGWFAFAWLPPSSPRVSPRGVKPRKLNFVCIGW